MKKLIIWSLLATLSLSLNAQTPYTLQLGDIDLENGVIMSYHPMDPSKTNIIIPAQIEGQPVISIGQSAFRRDGITSVTFVEGLESIGKYAFGRNENLTGSIEFPASLKSIGEAAFRDANISRVTFGEGLESIGKSAFSGNPNLTGTINFPASLKSIGEAAFWKNNINGVTFGEGLESIGKHAFLDNYNLTGIINFPASLKSIGEEAFWDANITRVTFSEGLESIGEYAFYRNDNLTGTIEFPASLKSIGEKAFYSNNISGVTFTEGLESIGNLAFYNNNISAVVLPRTLTFIGNNLFGGYTNSITSFLLPQSPAPIGYRAIWLGSDGTKFDIGSTISISYSSNNDIRLEYEFKPFKTTWLISVGDKTITIPTFGDGYDYSVDWGDETSSSHQGNATHTYAAPGEYQVSISGDFPRIYFNNTGDKEKIISVDQWGGVKWQSMENAFYGCENMQINDQESPILMDETSMASAFRDCDALNADLNNWDVSHVTNMDYTFYHAVKFNGDISSWDVSKVKSMKSMFHYASVFNQDIGDWKVDSVQNMYRMFHSAYQFNQDLDWDVSQVHTFTEMFKKAHAFNGNISNWNTKSAIYMSSMFYAAKNFNQDLFWDVDSVNTMRYMFYYALTFDGDISGWNTERVKDTKSMFHYASVFNQDISGWKVDSVTNMESMFLAAYKFNQDISTWNPSSAVSLSYMFRNAISFNQNIGNWDISNVKYIRDILRDARSFDQNLGGWDISNLQNLNNAILGTSMSTQNYDQTLTGWATLDPGHGETAIPRNLSLNAAGLTYCTAAPSRWTLSDNYNWTITGDTYNCSPGARLMADELQTESLTNNNQLAISQNYPNPFSNYTIINVQLPEGTTSSQMLIYDFQGHLVSSITLDQPGAQKIKISGDGLDQGLYLYTLVADGQVLDTKRMILTQ